MLVGRLMTFVAVDNEFLQRLKWHPRVMADARVVGVDVVVIAVVVYCGEESLVVWVATAARHHSHLVQR